MEFCVDLCCIADVCPRPFPLAFTGAKVLFADSEKSFQRRVRVKERDATRGEAGTLKEVSHICFGLIWPT